MQIKILIFVLFFTVALFVLIIIQFFRPVLFVLLILVFALFICLLCF